MTDTAPLIDAMEHIRVFVPLTDEFHVVNHLIPKRQEVIKISPQMPVARAFDIMRHKFFSQLPVVARNQVLGVFSYRSFAEKFLNLNAETKEKLDLGQYHVIDFMEQPQYVHIYEGIEKILPLLNENDYLLVGQMDQLLGVITALDLARYLNLYASILILLGEIELTIRKIIRVCVEDDEELRNYAVKTLMDVYGTEENIPTTIEHMTFNDYVQIIGDGQCYKSFERIFGASKLHRKQARVNLEGIRDLRNDAFHFKRTLEAQDVDKLLACRDWLKTLTLAYENLSEELDS